MQTPRLLMRLPAHVLNGAAVSVGIALIEFITTALGGRFAALAAASVAICASLADLPLATARTVRRVAAGALGAWTVGLVVALLREYGVAMGLTTMVLAFCSTMILVWGIRAAQLAFIPILALIFTLAAPPPPTRYELLLHVGWSAVGGLLYFAWAVFTTRLLQPRYRTLALASALQALAALLRSRAMLFSLDETEDSAPPLQAWIRSQVALDDRLQAARDLLFPAAGARDTGAAIAVLLQAIEMRDALLAGELDLEQLGHDAQARELRWRLRVHGMRLADAVDAMAQGLRDFGMQVPASAAAPMAEVDFESAGNSHAARPDAAAISPAAAAAASIGPAAASASALAPSAAADAAEAARDAAAVGSAAAQAVDRPPVFVGPPADPALRARRAAGAAKAQQPARAPLFANDDPRYPLAVAFYGRARQMVAVLARMQGALRGRATPLPLARQELQLFVSPEGWPLPSLVAQLNLRSPIFRHAVRMSLALGAAYFLGLLLPWASHPYWLVLSVGVVLRGNLEQTLSRRNDRVVGTMIGCLLVLLLGRFAAESVALACFIIAVGIAHSYMTSRFLITSAAASLMALMQAHLAAPETGFHAVERLGDTIIGAALAWGFVYVWPWWERRGVPQLVERVRKSLRTLTKEAMRLPDPTVPDLPLRLARREVYEAVGAIAATAQRSSAEPRGVQVPTYAFAELLTRCHVLMAQLAAVRLLLARRAPQFEGTEAARELEAACEALTAALDARTEDGARRAIPAEDIDHAAVPNALADHAALPWLRRRLVLATRAARRVGVAAEALTVAARS